MKNLFENTEIAFSLKSDTELDRAYFLFKLIANEPLVRIGTAVTNFALKASLPVEDLIRTTVFDHFCSGINELDSLKVVDKLYTKGVSSVLDYSVEGKEEEEDFNTVVAKTLTLIKFAKERQSIPFAVFKPTGFGRIDLYEAVGSGRTLTVKETDEWNRILARFEKVCQTAYDANVCLLIDAEESWMQDAADIIVESMMQKYNKSKAIIFNTLQMYRWDRLDYLKKLHKKAVDGGFFIGMKVVRGAYMEKENQRAEGKGYPSPICESKEATDNNYDASIDYMVNNIAVMSIFEGTHNENSTRFLMSLMEQNGIQTNDERIWFGQLYGMSDTISYNLANMGYNVAKYGYNLILTVFCLKSRNIS